jgi:hypothetical protein
VGETHRRKPPAPTVRLNGKQTYIFPIFLDIAENPRTLRATTTQARTLHAMPHDPETLRRNPGLMFQRTFTLLFEQVHDLIRALTPHA